MRAIWIIAEKDLRLLLRDPRAAIIMLVMPLLFIVVLGLSLGEGFGQTPDSRLRITIVDLDEGYQPARVRAAVAWLSATPTSAMPGLHPTGLVLANRTPDFPSENWSKRVLQDLEHSSGSSEQSGIKVEPRSLAEGQTLVKNGKRAAVLIFGPKFSERVAQCSFLADGINPFFRDGVDLKALDVTVLRDPTQATASSIIEQVAQGTMLRVVLPWMIGQAFSQIGDPTFIDLLSEEDLPKVGFVKLNQVLKLLPAAEKRSIANGLQNSLQGLFPRYDLTAKTWTSLTKSQPHPEGSTLANILTERDIRYQVLVPSYTVMFAFFLVLTMGWTFVGERRQGTLKRLCAAPLTRTQIVLGKLLPCFLMSLAQGLFLLSMGRLLLGLSWGAQPGWLLLVVVTTSLAAMGLALLVAALARTEAQVAIYGTLLVLILAGVSGCLLGDRSLLPELMQQLSLVTPHAWALDAYRQLLGNPAGPDLAKVAMACLVLTGFGLGFVGIAWWSLKLEGDR